MTMYNWIKLPDGNILNMNQVQFIRIVRLTNPTEQYQVLALFEGHSIPLASEIHQKEKAEQVVRAVLQAAAIQPIEVDTDLRYGRPKVASIPPELQGD